MDNPYYKVTDRLYIAGAGAVNAIDKLRADGICRVLKLYDGPPEWPSDFTVCDNAIDDGVFIPKDVLDYGVRFVKSGMDDGRPVMVVCGMGISRSATFVLASLLENGHDLKDAFMLLRAARPQAWPMRALWNSLITHYNLNNTLDEIETWRTA